MLPFVTLGVMFWFLTHFTWYLGLPLAFMVCMGAVSLLDVSDMPSPGCALDVRALTHRDVGDGRCGPIRQPLRGTLELINTPAMAAFFQASFVWCLIPYCVYIMQGTRAVNPQPPPDTAYESAAVLTSRRRVGLAARHERPDRHDGAGAVVDCRDNLHLLPHGHGRPRLRPAPRAQRGPPNHHRPRGPRPAHPSQLLRVVSGQCHLQRTWTLQSPA